MSPAVILYLVGMALIYVGERLLGGDETWRVALSLSGVIVIGLSFAVRVRTLKQSENEGVGLAHRRAIIMQAIGASSLLVYLLSTESFVDMAGFTGESERRWSGVFGALWPVIWLVGTLPYMVLDRAVQTSPVLMPARRVNQAMNQGLAAALGIALIFPINFIASRHDTSWNFSYFKTANPGTATIALVESLEQPIDVRIFQPAASDVTDEILAYFNAIDSPNLRVKVLDQAADPALAQALRITDNGYIALTKGEVNPEDKNPENRPITQRVQVGTELRKARGELKKLDEEFGRALVGVARGEITAYVTQGHGEASWGGGARADKSLEGFKQVVGFSGINLKKLGITEGLAEEIPEDAEIVFIIGPSQDFLPAEVDALTRYLERGGSVLVALEPTRPGAEALASRENLNRLLSKLGVKYGEGVLASTQQVVAMANNKADRMNVTTESFSTHPSTVVLAESPARMFVSIAGHIEKAERAEPDVTLTVRSPAHSWADLNSNLEFEAPQETKKARGIAIASSDKVGSNEWRAIVTSDATMFADMAIIVKGNQQFISDGANWLTRSEAFSGTVESEEDVRIQHTREGQAGWFYATVVGFPLLILILGGVRTRRRKGGDQ